MRIVRLPSLALFGTALLAAPGAQAAPAPECAGAMPGQGCHFTNVDDFSNGVYSHVSFDPPDERSFEAVAQKFALIDSIVTSGSAPVILHTSQHTADFPGEGTEGGPASGEYRIDWGYYGLSEIRLRFAEPVDAFGAFFGGVSGVGSPNARMTAYFADGSEREIELRDTRLGKVPNELASPEGECTAINGFLGIDSNGGAKIVGVRLDTYSEAASLDSFFIGTASGGANGPGVTRFPESPVHPDCARLGYPAPPALLSSPANAQLDSDGDGMPDAWETQYGLNPYDATDAAFDSDGDGVSNLNEYLNGTDPTLYDGQGGYPGGVTGSLEVDGSLRLVPQDTPPVECNTDTAGAMFYDAGQELILICNGSGWTSYRGPQGETGPMGPAGPEGPAGPAGKDAAFADIQCSQDQIVRFNGSEWVCAVDTLAALQCEEGQTIAYAGGEWVCAALPGPGAGAQIGHGRHKRGQWTDWLEDWGWKGWSRGK